MNLRPQMSPGFCACIYCVDRNKKASYKCIPFHSVSALPSLTKRFFFFLTLVQMEMMKSQSCLYFSLTDHPFSNNSWIFWSVEKCAKPWILLKTCTEWWQTSTLIEVRLQPDFSCIIRCLRILEVKDWQN